ncbi:hypothetical protein Q7P37_001513 [Cladosporium fusiforme]
MSYPNSNRKRPRDEDDDGEDTRGPMRGWSSQKRYEDSTASGHARQHLGDQYNGPVTIHNGPGAPTSASRSPEPGTVESALESLMFDEMDSRYLTISANLTTTCKWLYDREEYCKWQDVGLLSEHHGLFWIKGKAGAGKSTLMKYAFTNAEKNRGDNEVLISFFFNARGAPIEQSLEGMYRSLLYQIFGKLPRLRSLLNKRRTLSGHWQGWSLSLLQDVFRDAIESLGADRLTCYVDALDECTVDNCKQMVTFFEELGESSVENGSQFYVCFASRPYPYIGIRKSETMVLEDSSGHTEDISKYIRKKINIENRKLKQEMTQKIEERASGVFLWVVLVVGILNTDCDRGTAQTIRKRLDEIPTKMKDLIEDILERGGPTRYLVTLLQWVLFSVRPLSREELYLAVQCVDGLMTEDSHSESALSKENIEKFILNSSKGLAEMTKGKQPRVQFIHELVRTHFLDDKGLAKLDPVLQTNMAGKSHDRLKHCCFNYLLSETCSKTVLPTPLPKAGSPEHKQLRQKKIEAFPFLQYVLDNGLYHTNEAHAGGLRQNDFIGVFPLATWKRLHNVLAKYPKHQLGDSVTTAYISAKQGFSKLLEVALGNLPLPRMHDEFWYELLSASVEATDFQSTQIILSYSSPDNYREKDNGYLLWQATSGTDFDIVQALVKAGFKPYNPSSTKHSKSALVEAASNPDRFASTTGRFGLLRLMLNSISESDGENDHCRDALISALETVCEFGNTEFSKLLLAKGANTESKIGRGPLAMACKSGNEELVHLLIQSGARVIRSGRQDPLYWAATNGHEAILRLLIHQGAKIQGYPSALAKASGQGHENIVRLLLDAGADIESVDGRHQRTAMWHACDRGDESLVRVLVERGARVDVRCWNRGSALEAALTGGHNAIARFLVEKGATVDDSTRERLSELGII